MSKILFFVLTVLCLGFVVPAAHAQNTVPVHSIDSEWFNGWLVLGPFFPDNLEKDFLADVGVRQIYIPKKAIPSRQQKGKP